MSVNGYVHFSISVSNLEKSVDFYRDVIGFEVLAVKNNAFKGLGKSLGVDQDFAELKIALLKLPGSDIQVELIEYVEPKGKPYHKNPANAGSSHIAFAVKNIHEAVRKFNEMGVIFNSQINVQTEGDFKGWKWIYFKDPDGINLELVEMA